LYINASARLAFGRYRIHITHRIIVPNKNWFQSSLGNRFQAILPSDLSFDRTAHSDQDAAVTHRVLARSGALPFSDKTHSLIVLPHVLDSARDPHAVLREVNQILIPEGCVVMTGFNPMSLWRARLQRKRHFQNAPWNGHYYRVRRVQDWLSLLGFDIVGGSLMAYVPPIQNA